MATHTAAAAGGLRSRVILYYLFVVSLPLISHRIFGSDVGGMTVPAGQLFHEPPDFP
jgi:hypothetical protein